MTPLENDFNKTDVFAKKLLHECYKCSRELVKHNSESAPKWFQNFHMSISARSEQSIETSTPEIPYRIHDLVMED